MALRMMHAIAATRCHLQVEPVRLRLVDEIKGVTGGQDDALLPSDDLSRLRRRTLEHAAIRIGLFLGFGCGVFIFLAIAVVIVIFVEDHLLLLLTVKLAA